jgi:hypothetical protein
MSFLVLLLGLVFLSAVQSALGITSALPGIISTILWWLAWRRWDAATQRANENTHRG